MLRRTALLCLACLSRCVAALPRARAGQDLTVFAAASMKNALDDINAAFTKATGIKVVASYAASSALAKQIEQGAPADVFASADLDWMDYLAKKKLIKDDTRVNLLGNKLVLIAPKDSKIGNVDDRPGLRPRQARRRRPHRHRRRARGAGRQIRQGGAGKARRLDRGGAEIRHGRERARGAGAGRPRRSAARHRLRDRRQGRAERQDRRRISRRTRIRRSPIRWR